MRISRMGYAAAVLAAGVLLASACGSSSTKSSSGSSPSSSSSPSAGGSAGTYVAMGDSYSSGEGVPPFLPGSDSPTATPPDTCHRSTRAYSQVVGGLSSNVPKNVVFVACSGAIVSDFYHPNHSNPGEPPQLDALKLKPGEPPVKLVTLTIGGNDIGFSTILKNCLEVKPAPGSSGELNPQFSTAACDTQVGQTSAGELARLKTGETGSNGQPLDCNGHACTLRSLYDDIKKAAPDAKLVVMAYPPPLPSNGGACSGPVTAPGSTQPVGSFTWSLDASTTPKLEQVFTDLNATVEQEAKTAGATFASAGNTFDGHAACSSAPWFNGLELQGTTPSPFSFHPNEAGQHQDAVNLAAALGH